MPHDKLYTVRFFADALHSTIKDIPIALLEKPTGDQSPHRWHKHDTMEVAVVTGGTGRHFLNGQSALIQKGDILVIYPGLLHGFDECETLSLYNIMYNSNKLPGPILDAWKIPYFHNFFPEDMENVAAKASASALLHISSDEQLANLVTALRMLEQELTTLNPGNMVVSVIKLFDIIFTILRQGSPKVSASDIRPAFPLGNILEYLNRNYTRKISLGTLVKLSMLSRRVFQLSFKALTGYSVSEYISRKRIAHAQSLLTNEPNRTILDIALECGFCDASNFTYKFRCSTGMTPREYRRQAAHGGQP